MPRDPIGPVLRRLFELQQVGTGLTNEANSLLNDLFHEIAGEIARLDPTSPPQEASKRKRVEKLVGSVDDLVGRKSEEVGKLLRDRVAHVGAAEAKWAESLLEVTLGGVAVDITRSTVGVNMMKAILDSEPFEGELLEGWVDATSHRIVTRVRREIQLGMVRGETMGDLVRRVRGRSDGQGGFSGGVWEATTRDAESVVRTAVNFISNRGHLATYKQNADVLKELRFTATLDGQTSDICIALDSRTTDPEDPDPDLVPPRHFRCRSVLIPVVDWEGLGIEPPPEGERASQDGPVSASTDYEQWLKDQPAPFQDEVLGPERAQLFRDGKISLRELIDDDQRVLTIEELRTRSGLPAN